jgi:hypothetical protein
MGWFWCLEHKTVEEGIGCGSGSRIGPADTPGEAASALERIRQREAEQKTRDAEEEKKHGRRRDWF